MGGMQKIVVAIGRVLMSLIFLLSAVHKIIDWQGAEEMLSKALNHTLSSYPTMDWMNELVNFLLPWSSLLLVFSLLFELAGGLMLFFGMRVRLGAILLLLFLIPTTLFFHGFWTYEGADRQLQMMTFLQNTSIIGGLMVLFGLSGCSKKLRKIEAEKKG